MGNFRVEQWGATDMRQASFDDPTVINGRGGDPAPGATPTRHSPLDGSTTGLTIASASEGPGALTSPVPRASRRSRAVRLAVAPLAGAAAVALVLVLVGLALGVDARVVVGMLVPATVRVALTTPPHTVSSWVHGWVVARSLGVTFAFVVVVLSALHASSGIVDDTILLGTLAALVSGAVALGAASLRHPPRVLLVGDADEVRRLHAQWQDRGELTVVGARLSGEATPTAAAARSLGLPLVGDREGLADFVAEHDVDVVLVGSATAAVPGAVRSLEWQLEGTAAAVLCAHAADHAAVHRLGWTSVDGTTFAVVSAPATALTRSVKTISDRVLGLALLLLFAPLIAVLAVLVRLDSRGPAVFAQTRVGHRGRPFTLYKLRTMTVDAEVAKVQLVEQDEGNGVLFKIRNDPRVTRLGRFLRASSVDELPQLWNVVRGDMSLVGPRPALPEEVALYTDLEVRRLAVKPGMTGPWQVSGRSSLSRERSMQLDAGYADNWHPAGDARILLRTVDAVLLRRGAF